MQYNLPHLDIPTLLTVHLMVAAVSAIVIFTGALQTKGRFGLWYWCASFAATLAFQLLRDYGLFGLDVRTAYMMGQFGVLLHAAFIVLGVRAYLGIPLQQLKIAGITVLAATALFVFKDTPAGAWITLAITLTTAGVLHTFSLVDLLEARRQSPGFALNFAALFVGFLILRLLLRGVFAILPVFTDGTPSAEISPAALMFFITVLLMQGFAVLLLINEQLQKKMLALAEYDELTGLLNRRGMINRFTRMQLRAFRSGSPQIYMAIIDIDHFKLINDRYGHAIGDQALIGFARRLETLIRPNDICARLGGEEFAIFWFGTQPEMAAAMTERIRLAVAIHPFQTRKGPLHFTVSIGSCRMRDDENLDELIDRADMALYAAKQAGRNQVVISPH